MSQTCANSDFVPRQEGCTGEETRRVGAAELARCFTQLKLVVAEDDGSGEVMEVPADQRKVVELEEAVVRVAPRVQGPPNDFEKSFERKVGEFGHGTML